MEKQAKGIMDIIVAGKGATREELKVALKDELEEFNKDVQCHDEGYLEIDAIEYYTHEAVLELSMLLSDKVRKYVIECEAVIKKGMKVIEIQTHMTKMVTVLNQAQERIKLLVAEMTCEDEILDDSNVKDAIALLRECADTVEMLHNEVVEEEVGSNMENTMVESKRFTNTESKSFMIETCGGLCIESVKGLIEKSLDGIINEFNDNEDRPNEEVISISINKVTADKYKMFEVDMTVKFLSRFEIAPYFVFDEVAEFVQEAFSESEKTLETLQEEVGSDK